MGSREQMTALDFEDIKVGDVCLALYPRGPKIVSGYLPFTVTKASAESVHVMFLYPVRIVGGVKTIRGDEPSILFQNPRTQVWTAYGATAGNVPIKVGKLEGQRRAKYDKELEYRKEWLKSHPLPATKYPMGTETIKEVEKLIHAQVLYWK